MSRSGYSDDNDDNWVMIKWRGQVASAIRGKRGQSFLREMAAAMDAMPEKRLIAYDLERDGNVCAIGAVGLKRGVDMAAIDVEDPYQVANAFGIAHQLASEIEFMNDEDCWRQETPEERWKRMRCWVGSLIKDESACNNAKGIITAIGADVKSGE